jgi:hypothetical protein
MDTKSVTDNNFDSDFVQSQRQKAMSQISSSKEIPDQQVMVNNFNKTNYHRPKAMPSTHVKFNQMQEGDSKNKSEKNIPKLNLNKARSTKNQNTLISQRRRQSNIMEAVNEDMNDDDLE